MRILAALLAVVTLSGCGLISVSTNIPFLNGSGTTLEVVNASDYEVSLTVNGDPQRFEFLNSPPTDRLKPGQSAVISRTNWNRQAKELTIVAKAWCEEEMVGVTYRKMYVYNNYNQSGAWTLCDEDFVKCHSWR
jgi:hypothetical protein